MILILDLGGPYSRFLGRNIRESEVYCEIVPYNYGIEKIKAKNPEGIIISGGEKNDKISMENIDRSIFDLGLPVLSIGYGADLVSQIYGGKSISKDDKYGFETVKIDGESILFNGLNEKMPLWLNKEYVFKNIPENFKIIGQMEEDVVAIENRERKLYGVKFHPEIKDSKEGKAIIDNFLFKICNCNKDWNMEDFVDYSIKEIKAEIGNEKAICALSGGVDSSVAAVLVHKAIGDNLTCVFVDHGLLRKNEREEVERVFRDEFHMNLITVDARERFLNKLKGVTDPEKKRKIIGEEFIRVFEEEQEKLEDIGYLVQGTIYPDVIESGLVDGKVAVKSHHNVGGLPEDVDFELVEPLRQLFKDEVREVGRNLGISSTIIDRQPFPGPGLGIRVLGEITEEKLNIVREADYIFRDEIKKAGLEKAIWQYYAALLNIRSVGVSQGERTYNYTIALRAVNSIDGMTAEWVKIPLDILERVSDRITEEVEHVNRVVYDITNKPPATIEWE